jgi:hypothetical protein
VVFKVSTLHRDAIPGVPDSLLADCVLTMGKRGGGKSFFFRLAMERALTRRVRCGWIDAMGVGWGVTVSGDGKNPGFPNVVVFGGLHGHLPITEGAGKALGRTLAKATFSWVLDLSTMPSKAARVRFMADFVDALYEACDTPLLLFLDEVDIWAPQMILDKQGPSAALLGAMHELVRRGRVKGLSVWMATQRPAEVSKGIISQADALVTFKLMAPQDLDAAMAWMKGHVGKAKAAEWAAEIPTLKVGSAIVYLTEPVISIERVAFPLIQTLDTFKPPKKGDAPVSDKARASVDLEAIKAELGTVEEELKANDPAVLKATIRDLHKALHNLEREKAKAVGHPATPAITVEEMNRERAAGHWQGVARGWQAAWREAYRVGWQEGTDKVRLFAQAAAEPKNIPMPLVPSPPESLSPPAGKGGDPAPYRAAAPPRPARKAVAGPLHPPVTIDKGDLTGPERKIMTALAEWRAIGFSSPTREQVAVLAGYAARTGSFLNALGSLRSCGLIEYGTGTLSLTAAGQSRAVAEPFDSADAIQARILKQLSGPESKIFGALLPHGTKAIDRDRVAHETGYAPRTGSFLNALGSLRTMKVIDYENPGKVYLRPWVFMETE